MPFAAPSTRFAAVPPRAAWMLLAALALLIGYGLTLAPLAEPTGRPGGGDAALYRAVADRVAHGQAYHAAAAAEQRARGYPVRPFGTMRPPLLATIGATLGPNGADLLLRLIGVAATAATVMRLAPALRPPVRETAILLAATAGGVLLQPGMWVWHEVWAGLLVTLALATSGGRGWPMAIGFGLAAALIRELALPVLAMMAIAAMIGRRRGEAIAWGLAIIVAATALAGHASAATAAARIGDAASPGWLALSGWRFDLALARQSALLLALPAQATAVALPLALLGWAGWRSDYAARVTLTLGAWLSAFLFVGRADNGYWGFLLAPLLPVGLAFAPAALRDLMAAALPSPRFRSPARLARAPLCRESPEREGAAWPFNPTAGSASRRSGTT